MEARVAERGLRPAAAWRERLPALVLGGALATLAGGLAATALGAHLGSDLPPLFAGFDPTVGLRALPAAASLAAAVVIAPRLRSARVSPLAFAAAVLVLALWLRLALSAARDGTAAWQAPFDVARSPAAANEYLQALPALGNGLGFFLDRFAELGRALPVHAVGHPPGLLVTIDLLGLRAPGALAAFTIGTGALAAPLVYVLGRRLLDGETAARTAGILFALAPSALLYGATSADALYVTLGLIAAIALVAERKLARALGPPLLALASFFSYALLGVGAWAAVVRLRREGIGSALRLALASAAAVILFYVLLYALTGFDLLGALGSARDAYRGGIANVRPYAFWLVGSPAAFLLALGLPIAWYALRGLSRGETIALALAAVVVAAAVLGFTKAEVERIWLFLVPFACLAAAAALPERRLTPVLGLLAAQALATELLLDTVW